jgi:hypothetical protein
MIRKPFGGRDNRPSAANLPDPGMVCTLPAASAG